MRVSLYDIRFGKGLLGMIPKIMSNKIKKTSSKLKPFVLQRTSARKWKDNPQNGTKYLQIMYQEIPGVTGKFGRGVQSEAGQRLIEFC